MANYLNFKVTSPPADFTTKLHIIYLVNDVLHHCVRKNNLGLKSAFEKVGLVKRFFLLFITVIFLNGAWMVFINIK